MKALFKRHRYNPQSIGQTAIKRHQQAVKAPAMDGNHATAKSSLTKTADLMRYGIAAGALLFIIVMSFASVAFSLVKGVVIDKETGSPLKGVNVQLKGSFTRVVTDASGNFTITMDAKSDSLNFTAEGYQSVGFLVKDGAQPLLVRMTPIKGKTRFAADTLMHGEAKRTALEEKLRAASVKSKPGSTKNEEVRITGYTTENEHMVASADVSAPLAVLQGRVAGLSVRTKSVNIRREAVNHDREGYDGIAENNFKAVTEDALSTFSIDVDAASYSNVRRMLSIGQLPPAGAVRIEEMINYFKYDYKTPTNNDPFSINTEIAACPWNPQHQLVSVGLQGKRIPVGDLPASNLVFLIDVSGSMSDANKLPLVQQSLKLLVDQLRDKDRVALVVYAGNAGLVLPSTSGAEKMKIKDAIDRLESGGSTAGGAGIQLAYKTAQDHFMKGGNNRIILCSDGDFNVGTSSDAALETLIETERKSGVYLTILGYGMGNYQDAKMQKLATRGNGNHAYIDNLSEARKVLVKEFGGTLFTIAKDVKLQVEFNPSQVQAYRLVGYENRMLNKEDFNDDLKDAGELGSGHTVTALYEIIPVGIKSEFIKPVDQLKYQKKNQYASATSNELMTIKFRYKQPDGGVSKLITHPVVAGTSPASDNFRFAAAVAEFGMVLRNSAFKQQGSYDNAWKLAKGALGNDEEGYRAEFLRLIRNAQDITRGVSVR
jgi:Ca-activated chloride channel homolog